MQTIIFLKRLGVLMGLMGGYRALGGRNAAFREKELLKGPCVDGRCFREDGFPKRKLIS